jgi:hypothetical protein
VRDLQFSTAKLADELARPFDAMLEEGLPNEVRLLILKELPDRRDLKQLCAVSKKLYNSTLPKLYETVVISSESEKHLERIDIKPFLEGNSTDRLKHTKHFRISSLFHQNLDERCLHFRDIEGQVKYDFDEQLEERAAGGRTKFQTLAANVVGLLQQLQYESLTSFSWELGTCIPKQILGRMGCLPLMQTSLEDITLVTWSGCHDENEDDSAVDLSKFHAIRRISWIGSDNYTQALRVALETNSKHLTDLQLEYVNRPNGDFTQDDDTDDDIDNNEDEDAGDQREYQRNFFAREALGLKRSTATSEVIFPALTSLSLGFISLKNAEKALVHALNTSGLLHLTLRQCPGMEDFLRVITESGQTLKLLSLEYHSSLNEELDVCSTLEGIFDITTDLTDLFLSIPGPTVTLELWRKLADKKIPLTRFVYHQRCVNLNENSSRFEEEEDLLDLSLLPDDMDELERAGEQHPFAQMNLMCLGLGGDLFTVKKILTSPIATKSLKLLHIRKSGPDMVGSIEKRGRMFQYYDVMSDSEEDDDDDMATADDEAMEQDTEAQMIEDTAPADITGNNLSFKSSTAPATASRLHDAEDEADRDAIYELKNLPRNLLRFARWAFGADGIPSLQVLAYGDFSFEDRFGSKNHILCRQAWKVPRRKKDSTARADKEDKVLPFRPIRITDIKMMELVSENMDFLGACPVDSIVMKQDD